MRYPTTKMSRSVAALALVLARRQVFDLEVGDCFEDGDISIGPVVEEVGDFRLIDCAEPHDNEVYEMVTVEGEKFPGVEAIADQADVACLDVFEGFVGHDYASSVLDFGRLCPRPPHGGSGDRLVACFVYRLDLENATGTLQGSGL